MIYVYCSTIDIYKGTANSSETGSMAPPVLWRRSALKINTLPLGGAAESKQKRQNTTCSEEVAVPQDICLWFNII